MSDGVCVRACAPSPKRPCVFVCVCVFACLSHDVLWRSLTNRAGASGRAGGGGGWRRVEGMRRSREEGRGAKEPRRERGEGEGGGTRADYCHMMGM